MADRGHVLAHHRTSALALPKVHSLRYVFMGAMSFAVHDRRFNPEDVAEEFLAMLTASLRPS